MIEYEMQRLLQKAKENEQISAPDPLKAFCDEARDMGFEIYLGELFAYGMTMNDAKLRATNGGGSFEIEGWNDLYENLLEELQ